MMTRREIRSSGIARGEVRVPGSKSVSNRYLNMAMFFLVAAAGLYIIWTA